MNFSALDLNLLRVFNAMMIELNTTRAGERLGLSQPAVSSALGRLRHITGDELLVRDGNRMVPTPQALALCEPIRSALKQIENALSVNAGFDPATSNQIFRISGADYFSTLLMPALAESVVPVTSGVMLQMLGYPAGEVIDLLSEATIDIALDRPLETPDWICSQVLFRSYLVCVTAKNHPILIRDGVAPGDRIPAQTFCSIPQVIMSMDGGTVGTIDAALKEKGLERRVAMTVPHFQAVALSAANGLLGNMPVHFALYAARILELDIFLPPHDPPGMNIMMYWHRRLDRNVANMWLREQIAQAMNFELPSAASLAAL